MQTSYATAVGHPDLNLRTLSNWTERIEVPIYGLFYMHRDFNLTHKYMNNTDIVMKLIGPIDPVGDSSEDSVRLQNMKSIMILVEDLINEIHNVALKHPSTEASVSRAGNFAKTFLQQQAEELTLDW